MSRQAGLGTVAREWGRLGVIGFGGPPAHIVLLRQLCVERRRWISAPEFEDAIAVCNLLPGPASTQLAIYCASRVAGWPGAIVGGAGFILPGLTIILGLAALFLSGSSPEWARALGAGGGAAVAAVAVRAGVDLMGPSWLAAQARRARWVAYVAAGAASAVVVGPWLVLVLLGCGLVELAIRRGRDIAGAVALLAAAPATGGWGALAWTAFKVGGLSYGGGFVIIPLMQADAVSHYHWVRPHPHRPQRAGVPGGRRARRDRRDPRRRRPARRGARRAVAVRRPGGRRRRAPRLSPERGVGAARRPPRLDSS